MSKIFPKIDLKFYSNIKITTKLMIFFFFFFLRIYQTNE